MGITIINRDTCKGPILYIFAKAEQVAITQTLEVHKTSKPQSNSPPSSTNLIHQLIFFRGKLPCPLVIPPRKFRQVTVTEFNCSADLLLQLATDTLKTLFYALRLKTVKECENDLKERKN